MNTQDTLTIIIPILVPMLSGLAWIIHQIGDLKTRVTVIETILSMTKFNDNKTRIK